jgi:hypothetical protein
MERDHIKNDARRACREDRLGGKGKTCLLCGDARIEVLIQVVQGFLEKHHLTGRNHGPDFTVLLCPTCHKWITALYLRNGVAMPAARDLLRRSVMRLRAIGTFLPELGRNCNRWAGELEKLADALDRRDSSWRDMPEAK